MSPLRSLASRPTWLMLGSMLTYIPVYMTFTDLVGQSMVISGPSMYPFLNTDYNSSLEKDVVWVSKLNPTKVQRGQIVAFWSPNNPETMAVKRIIAMEGDEVRTKSPYPFPTEVVPVGHVWVEGDNPDGRKNMDSNWYGPVSKNLIVGKVKAVMFPWPKMGFIRWQDYTGSSRVTENKVRIIPRQRSKDDR